MSNDLLAVFSMPGGMEWLIILIIGLLLFGRRLPDVARSVGKSIVEFKKGIKDVNNDIDRESDRPRQKPQLDRTSPEGTVESQDRETAGASKP